MDFAVSDSPFSSAQLAATPDLYLSPALAAAVGLIYNLPELHAASSLAAAAAAQGEMSVEIEERFRLVLDKSTLVRIFTANITQWNGQTRTQTQMRMRRWNTPMQCDAKQRSLSRAACFVVYRLPV